MNIEELTRSAQEKLEGNKGQGHFKELQIALDPANPAHSMPIIEPGEKVVDLGCGAGQILIGACPYRVPGEGGLCVTCSRSDCPTWGYGVDLDDVAIQLGRRWSQKMVLRQGTAESIPYGDGEFDVVMSRVTLPYVNIPKAVREIRRVLRPGGRVWLTLHSFSTLRVGKTPGSWKRLACITLNGIILHLTLRSLAVCGGRESWQSESAMRRLLERTGFSEVCTRRTSRCFVVTARG